VAKWVAFAVILIIPQLVLSDYGRRWFLEPPRSIGLWVSVGLGAASAGLAWIAGFPAPLSAAKAALVTIPLLQAATFIALDKTFRLFTQRVPVTFHEMRFGRRPDGRRHRADIVFWLLSFFLPLAVGVSVCLFFDITLPSRHHASFPWQH
jgi:hypothetical protein